MKLIQAWKATRGKKRHSGAMILILPMLIRLVARLAKFDIDSMDGADDILTALLSIGGIVYGVGWLDVVLPKILKWTQKIEKILGLFNAWGKSQIGNKGKVSTTSAATAAALAAILATAVTVTELVGVDYAEGAERTTAIDYVAPKHDEVFQRDTVIGNDTLIVFDTVAIDARIVRPKMRYNPLVYAVAADVWEVSVKCNGKIVHEYKRTVPDSLMPGNGFGLLPIVKFDLVKSHIPVDSVGNKIVLENSVVLSTRR